MKSKSVAAIVLAISWFGGSAAGAEPAQGLSSPASDYLRDFRQAERDSKIFNPITDFDHDITIAQAYSVQRQIIKYRLAEGDHIAGYKGGLMSAKSLADKGVREPIIGTLFASGVLQDGATADICRYRRAAFEMKLGYEFGASVKKPIAGIDQLKTLVRSVRPVVDLPDIAYRDPNTYGAIDMVAANITASKFVEGAARPAGDLDLNALNVSMTQDGKAITQGSGKDSLGEQWESLRTVVNLAIAKGEHIAKGAIVLTGKIGDKGTITPGHYLAHFGSLGDVGFQIDPCRQGGPYPAGAH